MDATVREFDLQLRDGRNLHCYDRTPDGRTRLAVHWHHGSPNLGAPPEPLFALSDRLGVRWLGHDRPGYGSSTPSPGRSIGADAADVAALADALDIDRFAVMGHSGGGPHALAAAALLTDRVSRVVAMSGPAPYDDAFDFFAGMADPGELRAATAGRAARAAYEAAAEEAPPVFTEADWAALEGDWAWVLDVVRPAMAAGPEALIDDDVATVSDWGFRPASIRQPVLLVHGGEDRMVPVSHARRLHELIAAAELTIADADGHVSVLAQAPAALSWLTR
jgi:pimeloyl-ACP methyl ester carboxylesterase